jgi:hypothetical protein
VKDQLRRRLRQWARLEQELRRAALDVEMSYDQRCHALSRLAETFGSSPLSADGGPTAEALDRRPLAANRYDREVAAALYDRFAMLAFFFELACRLALSTPEELKEMPDRDVVSLVLWFGLDTTWLPGERRPESASDDIRRPWGGNDE